MKTVIYLGVQKNFSGIRLGVQLAHVLAASGQEIVLAGKKTDLPAYTPFELLPFAPAAGVKSMTAALQKVNAQKVISFVNLPVCESAHALHIPFIYVEPENFKEDKPVKNKKAILKESARVVVIGNKAGKLNGKMYPSNAVRAQNPAVWVEHYNYNKPACFKKENNIVAAGNFTKAGGFDILLQTWARLAPAHHTWHLTLVGEGTQKAALKKFVQDHHLQSSTEILGKEADLYSLLRNADIFVSPARTADGLSTVLDAMASKLPVLATDVEGMDELVSNGINGVIVNAGEEEPLTVALDELMVNWGKRVGFAVQAVQQKNRYPFELFTVLFEND